MAGAKDLILGGALTLLTGAVGYMANMTFETYKSVESLKAEVKYLKQEAVKLDDVRDAVKKLHPNELRLIGMKDDSLLESRNLEFVGFTTEELTELEDYLTIFSGYSNHRPLYSGSRNSTFIYSSSISIEKLRSNIDRTLKVIGIEASVETDNNSIVSTKLRPKKGLK